MALGLLVVLSFINTATSISQEKYAHEAKSYFSAVSPDFPDGLHTSFITFIAEKLNAPIQIGLIPFARRIKELEKGTLDIMVGVEQSRGMHDNVYLIEPAYVTINVCFFVNPESQALYSDYNSLNGKKIAITRHAKVIEDFWELANVHIVEVDSLQQKIEMLKLRRIDGFFHTEKSTFDYIMENQLEAQVVRTSLKSSPYRIHVAISRNGKLWKRRQEIEYIVKNAIENGDFEALRIANFRSVEIN